MDEQEDAHMAQKMMEGNRRGPMDEFRQNVNEPMIDPMTGVRAPDAQRNDRLIGGPDENFDENIDDHPGVLNPGFAQIHTQNL
jgi:hypothetical protein